MVPDFMDDVVAAVEFVGIGNEEEHYMSSEEEHSTSSTSFFAEDSSIASVLTTCDLNGSSDSEYF